MNRKIGQLIISILLLGLHTPLIYSQKLIENPDKPLAENANRILQFEQIWEITDDSGDYFLRFPHNLQIAQDGSIFIVDSEQFMKFSKDGRFLQNLYKQGQGPGEISGRFYYQIDGDTIYIHDLGPNRMWKTDLDGKFLSEFYVEGMSVEGFLGVNERHLTCFRIEQPVVKTKTAGFIDIPVSIIQVSKQDTTAKKIHTFSFRAFHSAQGQRVWDTSLRCINNDGTIVFGYHGLEYMIEVLDIQTGSIIHRFSRKYTRIKHIEKEWEKQFRANNKAPQMEYESDVVALKMSGEYLWVATSTNDKDKGRLWDVFNRQGKWIDSFYIGMGRSIMRISGDFLFALERNRDDTFRIIRYRITG